MRKRTAATPGLSRRRFLQSAGASVAAGALAACGGSDTFRPDPVAPSTPVEDLVKDDFSALVGQTVTISHPTLGSSDVELTACTDLSATYAPGAQQRDPFRLAWADPNGFTSEDGLYTFQHPQHGALSLYLFCTGASTFDVHFN